MFLRQSEVHITDINSRAFLITTNKDSYRLARSVLLALKEECSLPLHLHSEEVSEISKSAKARLGVFTTANYSAETIFEDNLPPRYGNIFLVTAHRLVGQNKDKVTALAKVVAQRLEAFELSVLVHE
jgi:hypothetical protein